MTYPGVIAHQPAIRTKCYRSVTAHLSVGITKAPIPSISRRIGAFIVAVTVGFAPIYALVTPCWTVHQSP